MQLPQSLTDFDAHLAGKGFIGVANMVKLPEINWKVIERDTTGAGGAYELATGRLEKLEAEVELDSLIADEVYEILGSNKGFESPLIIRGSLKTGAEDIPLKITIAGLWKSASFNELKPSEETKLKLKVSAQKFVVEVNSKEQIYVNLPTWEIRLNGKDKTSKIKANLGR